MLTVRAHYRSPSLVSRGTDPIKRVLIASSTCWVCHFHRWVDPRGSSRLWAQARFHTAVDVTISCIVGYWLVRAKARGLSRTQRLITKLIAINFEGALLPMSIIMVGLGLIWNQVLRLRISNCASLTFRWDL
jgi:hypothetical protein